MRALFDWAQWEGGDARPQQARLAVPKSLWIASVVLRTSFIVTLLILVGHASMPQTQPIWSIYDGLPDLIRLAVGAAMFVWTALQLFALPRDAHAYRTWLYLGLAGTPFLIVCIIGTW